MREYPWRFDTPKIGDKVFVISAGKNDVVTAEEVTIVEIQDNSYHSKVIDGMFSSEVERVKDWNECSIGYYVEEISFGHAMYFGETLFMTMEEALEAINKD